MYLWVVVPLEPSPLPNWAENSWERQDNSLPTGDISCCLGSPWECICYWITQLWGGQDPPGTGIEEWQTQREMRRHPPLGRNIQEHDGISLIKEAKEAYSKLFTQGISATSSPEATTRSQEEFQCYATKYLAKPFRSVQQIKSNAKRVCFQKELGISNVFEHLGAGFFLKQVTSHLVLRSGKELPCQQLWP